MSRIKISFDAVQKTNDQFASAVLRARELEANLLKLETACAALELDGLDAKALLKPLRTGAKSVRVRMENIRKVSTQALSKYKAAEQQLKSLGKKL